MSEQNIAKRSEFNYIFSYITKKISEIKDPQINKSIKKQSIKDLYTFIVIEKPQFREDHFNEIVINFNKDLLNISFFNKDFDTIREYALLSLIHIYSNISFITKTIFPFVFSAFVDKLDCSNLEGIDELPEEMRPLPNQKPQRIIKITEQSEEIRRNYVYLLRVLLLKESVDIDDYDLFMNDIVSIIKCLVMDVSHEVIKAGCELMREFALRFKKKLYFFNNILSRSLFLPLVSKQSKLKVLALEAIDALLECSPFKKNYEIFEGLIGFRDPNIVPIKDFYEASTKINYFALLVSDSKAIVRKRFVEIISTWLINKEDRFDYESIIVPYLLSGLSDSDESIAELTCLLIENVGKQQEEDNEKEMREEIQYGIDVKWASQYKSIDELDYPFPIRKRPSRGSRYLIKKYLRRYIKSLCKEFESIDNEIRLKCANLLMYSICYSEEVINEFLNDILLCLFKEACKDKYSEYYICNNKSDENEIKHMKERLISISQLIGRYVDYDSIVNVVYPSLKGEVNGGVYNIQKGVVFVFQNIIIGNINKGRNRLQLGIYGSNLKSLLENVFPKECIEYIKTEENCQDVVSGYIEAYSYEYLLFVIEIFQKQEFSVEDLTLFDSNQSIDILQTIYNIILKCISDIIPDRHSTVIKKLKDHKKPNSFHSNSVQTLKQLNSKIKLISETEGNLTLSSFEYKIFSLIVKHNPFEIDLFQSIDLIINIFMNFFRNQRNYLIFYDLGLIYNSTLLKFLSLANYISHETFECYIQIFYCLMKNLNWLNCNVSVSSSLNDSYKIKFVDLLGSEDELNKKQVKTVKYYMSKVKERVVDIYSKTMKEVLLKYIYSSEDENNSICNCTDHINEGYLKTEEHFFSKELLEEITNESIAIKSKYFHIVDCFMSLKYGKSNMNIKKSTETNKKYLFSTGELLFKYGIDEEDSEIKRISLKMIISILFNFTKSDLLPPLKSLLSNEGVTIQSLYKPLLYIKDEDEYMNVYFSEFEKVFSSVLAIEIDEGKEFKSELDLFFKCVFERFPIFFINQIKLNSDKGKLNRVDVLSKRLMKLIK